MRHTFQTEQWLPYTVETVFRFFANPENLPRLMPPWQKARIDTATFAPPPPSPAGTPADRGTILAGSGTRLTMSFRPFPFSPVRVPWDAEILDFAWNQQFCDIQHRGPFAFWKHCHRVSAQPRALDPRHPDKRTEGTLLQDHVVYEAPLGPLGDLADALLLRRQIAGTFQFRHRRTQELLGRLAANRT